MVRTYIMYMIIRLFQHATESREKILLALETVAGQKDYRETSAQGYHGNPISVLETALKSREEVEAFWERIRGAGLHRDILEELEERVSDEGELFLRFDKQEAVRGRLALSSGDDVVTVRVRVIPPPSDSEDLRSPSPRFDLRGKCGGGGGVFENSRRKSERAHPEGGRTEGELGLPMGGQTNVVRARTSPQPSRSQPLSTGNRDGAPRGWRPPAEAGGRSSIPPRPEGRDVPAMVVTPVLEGRPARRSRSATINELRRLLTVPQPPEPAGPDPGGS
ncbi:MAG: RNA-binding domain-containing protein [Thermoplasmatota archaeon]